MTPGIAAICWRKASGFHTCPSERSTTICGVNASRRARRSTWNPLITDSATVNAKVPEGDAGQRDDGDERDEAFAASGAQVAHSNEVFETHRGWPRLCFLTDAPFATPWRATEVFATDRYEDPTPGTRPPPRPRGSRDGAEPANAASRGRDVPVGGDCFFQVLRMPPGGGREGVRAVAPAPPPVRHRSRKSRSETAAAPAPPRVREGARNQERTRKGKIPANGTALRVVHERPLRRSDPWDFTPSPIRRGSRDGAEPAMAASRCRDVPWG